MHPQVTRSLKLVPFKLVNTIVNGFKTRVQFPTSPPFIFFFFFYQEQIEELLMNRTLLWALVALFFLFLATIGQAALFIAIGAYTVYAIYSFFKGLLFSRK
jgi:hypothetical protein